MNKIVKLFENCKYDNNLNTNILEEDDFSKYVKIDSGLHFDSECKKLAKEFLIFCAENLGLEKFPSIHILSQRHKGMTYGVFDPNTEEIKVYGKDRGFADILRTTAHELTHFWQKTENRIPPDLKSRDHKLESEANTKAGDLVYMFGLKNPSIYELGFKSDVVEKPLD